MLRVPTLVGAFATGAAILAASAAEPSHVITLDDYFTLATPFEAAFAPDGKAVAYTEARWQASTNDRKADVWLVSVAGGTPQRLTLDRAGYGGLVWSPDGRSLYAAAARKREGAAGPPYDGKTQVWRIALDGGEPQPVTQVSGGIGRYQLSGDGLSLYYTTSRQTSRDAWSALRGEFPEVEYSPGASDHTDFHRLDLNSWRTERLATLPKAVSDFAASDDGRRLAAVSAPEDKVSSFEGHSQVDVLNLASGQWTTLPDELWRAKAPSPWGRLSSLRWSPDGAALAFVIGFDGYPSELLLARWEGERPSIARLARPSGVSLHAGVDSSLAMTWRGDELCFLGEERGRVRIYCGNPRAAQAEFRSLTPGDAAVDAFGISRGGAVVAVMGGPAALPEVQLIESASARPLTRLNPQCDDWKWPRLEIVRWTSDDGTQVEGILERPADAPDDQPLPLIVFIHGGPTSMWPFQRTFNLYSLQSLMSARGYAIFCPNYRGSSGYGDAFLTDLIGHENDRDVADILAGVDALVDRKIADPQRLAVIGWSNGGYLTNCVVSKTDRFKAASSGAGIADKVMNWGINDEPAYAIVFAQGLPWQKPEVYARSSPVLDFGNVRTPTLFHVGANDLRCPPENSRMLHRALREYSDTPTELLVYPNEPHGLTRLQSRKAKMAWDAAWFDRYVRGTESK